jgi:A/G-specific adenine glycosylase
MLHEAAKAITKEYNGRFPEDASMLPGVGPYTARAIDAFSRNNNVIVVETNIRTAVLHHFFTKEKTKNHIIYDMVSDTEIEAVLIEALPLGHSREWYSALMDYGAYLKRSGIRLNRRHKGYTKQSKFTGSNREARGAILRALAKRPQTEAMLVTILGEKRKKQMEAALVALRKEQMIQKRASRYRLAR